MKNQAQSKLLNVFVCVIVGTCIVFVECILITEFYFVFCLAMNDSLGCLAEK